MRLFVALVVVVVGVLLWVGWLVGIASEKAGAQSRSLTSAPMQEGPRNEFTAVGGWVLSTSGIYSAGATVENTTTTTGDPLTLAVSEAGTIRVYGTASTVARVSRWRQSSGSWTTAAHATSGTTVHQTLLYSFTVDGPGDVEIERVSGMSFRLDFWTFEAAPPPTTTTTTTTTEPPTTTTTTEPPTTTTTTEPPPTTTTTAPTGPGTGTGSAAPAPTSLVVTCGLILFLGSLHVVASWRTR